MHNLSSWHAGIVTVQPVRQAVTRSKLTLLTMHDILLLIAIADGRTPVGSIPIGRGRGLTYAKESHVTYEKNLVF